MPKSFDFLVFSSLEGMQDAQAKSRIRKHAMKDIGTARRRVNLRRFSIVFEIKDAPSDKAPWSSSFSGEDIMLEDSRALYDPAIRALSCKPDPFTSVAFPIDTFSHGLMQYFAYYSTEFPNNLTFTPDITRVLHAAVRDDLMMNCILSAAASRICYMQRVSPTSFRQKALACTQQSLCLLRQRIGSEDSGTLASIESLVDCILYLAAASVYRDDLSSARVHVDAAARLTESHGGVRCFRDPRLLMRMLGLDDILACTRLQPCRLSNAFDPGPLPLSQTYQTGQLPVDDAMCGCIHGTKDLLPTQLRELIPQVVECDAIKDILLLQRGSTCLESIQINQWQRLRTLAIRNRLLAFTTADPRAEILRIVLIIWTLFPPNDPRQSRIARTVASHLQKTLERGNDSDWDGLEGVRAWCLIVGFFGASCGGDNCGFWFVDELRRFVQLAGDHVGLHISSGPADGLLRLQKRFLFREFLLGPLTEWLAKLMVLGSSWSRCVDEVPNLKRIT
jgi:hypothetical protein